MYREDNLVADALASLKLRFQIHYDSLATRPVEVRVAVHLDSREVPKIRVSIVQG